MKVVKLILVLGLLVLSTGCASKLMPPLPEGAAPLSIESGKPVIVFYRDSLEDSAIQAPVFELVGDEVKFLGIVSYETKLAHSTTPGKKTYMVVGTNANYLTADVRDKNIYYTHIVPRIGWPSARFFFLAIHGEDATSDDVKKALSECGYVQNTPQTGAWFQGKKADIEDKHDKYYVEWLNKPVADKATLHPEDGISY